MDILLSGAILITVVIVLAVALICLGKLSFLKTNQERIEQIVGREAAQNRQELIAIVKL